jgi:hypothetical protein
MKNRWCEEHNCYSDDVKKAEADAVTRGMNKFFELGFIGGLLRVNGEIQAFTFGEPLNSDTFVVHVEKAFTEYQGTYTAINREFVNSACKGFKFINREEDMGAENLRKAKMSYYPSILLEKYKVKFKS